MQLLTNRHQTGNNLQLQMTFLLQIQSIFDHRIIVTRPKMLQQNLSRDETYFQILHLNFEPGRGGL